MKRSIQFEEHPIIDDVIIALKEAKELGYTKFIPSIVLGDNIGTYIEKVLRIELIK